MTSVASTLVPGFPSMYVLNGPNGSLGHNSAVLMMEAQAEFVLRCLADGRTIDATDEAERAYTAEIDERAAQHLVGRRRMPQLVRRRALRPPHPAVAGHRRGVPRRASPPLDPAAFAREPSPLSEGTP